MKNLFELLRKSITPIHKEGYPFIFIFAIVSLFLGAVYEPFGWIGAVATLWCCYFFRDPDRFVPLEDNLIVSPADGLVQKIEKALPPLELGLGDEELVRVSIFLNVFDVHVNRAPIAGEITQINYHPGKFLSANLDKASDDNERNTIVINSNSGKQVICVQIAGLVARRIVCDVVEKQSLKKGERYGIIRFGSRVDIYLPKGVNPLVIVGQRAIGGETIIADMKGKYEARLGEKI